MIERVGADAAEMLASLHAASFAAPWSAAEFAALMANSATFALVAREGGSRLGSDAVGFVLGWAAAGEGEVLTLAVVPEARRAGVGASLVEAACAAVLFRGAARLRLEVAETNLAARALYRKLGFAEVGRRPGYYAGEAGQVDALVLARDLPGPGVSG